MVACTKKHTVVAAEQVWKNRIVALSFFTLLAEHMRRDAGQALKRLTQMKNVAVAEDAAISLMGRSVKWR